MLHLTDAQVKTTFQDGLRRMNAGDYLAAKAAFEKIVLARADRAEPHFHLGRALLSLGRPVSALASLKRAHKLAPAEFTILEPLATAFMRAGDAEASLEVHDQILKLKPKEMKSHLDKAVALQQMGRFEAAERIFAKVHRMNKLDPELYRIWFATRKVTKKDRRLIQDAVALWKHPKLLPQGRMHLGFGLAKAFSDLGEHDRMFKFLHAANEAQASEAQDSPQSRLDLLGHVKRIAPNGDVARRGNSTEQPIIVVGVPRSGTTLIEQILAAHPDVRSAGELGQARPLANLLFGGLGNTHAIEDIAPKDLSRYADHYWTAADETARGEGVRIVDKSMLHHLVLGNLAAAFPKARFIVVRREPRDVALSIYKNHFALGTHTYANRFETIAHHMLTYEAALDVWRDKVDMTEVSYDALTADPEPEIRALVTAAGLPWDDACLDHSRAQGLVTTLSIAQVRQPIYKSSSGGWRKHEKELAPFIDTWEAGL
ncbi:MAG: sulfotransferase [Marinovum sp.]|nr:sulfotransferase [Marinovum sp.]